MLNNTLKHFLKKFILTISEIGIVSQFLLRLGMD